jgi:hypothetical protein
MFKKGLLSRLFLVNMVKQLQNLLQRNSNRSDRAIVTSTEDNARLVLFETLSQSLQHSSNRVVEFVRNSVGICQGGSSSITPMKRSKRCILEESGSRLRTAHSKFLGAVAF